MIPSSFESFDEDFLAAVAPAGNSARTAPPLLWEEILTWDEERLAQTDPAVLNLEVAKKIPAFADLHVNSYCQLLDETAVGFARWLPVAEQEFEADPGGWDGDFVGFRLGMLCQYLDQVLGVYIRGPAGRPQDPVHQSRRPLPQRGAGHAAGDVRQHGRPVPLPVLASWLAGIPRHDRWHDICRYEDGTRTVNIEATAIGLGGFLTPPDEFYIKKHHLLSGTNLVWIRPHRAEAASDARLLFRVARPMLVRLLRRARGGGGLPAGRQNCFQQSRLWKEELQRVSSLAYGKDSVWQVT